MKAKALTVSHKDYERIRTAQFVNGTIFSEHIHGSSKKLFANRKLIAMQEQVSSLHLGALTQMQFVAFLGAFSRNLYNQFKTNPALYDLKIDFKGVARAKNQVYWDSLNVDQYFYNVDLSSAYWQIAHKLGYISTKFFTSYMDVDSYKQAKRYCISFLARSNKMRYCTTQGMHEIQCDTSVLRQVYDNIRYELYNAISSSLDKENYLEYNIDGVMVNAQHLNDVMERFKCDGLKFKITQCKKVSDTQYLYRSTLRNFKTNLYATQTISSN